MTDPEFDAALVKTVRDTPQLAIARSAANWET
jgi:hypothetical protein